MFPLSTKNIVFSCEAQRGRAFDTNAVAVSCEGGHAVSPRHMRPISTAEPEMCFQFAANIQRRLRLPLSIQTSRILKGHIRERVDISTRAQSEKEKGGFFIFSFFSFVTHHLPYLHYGKGAADP
jgi:hypothetical protein